MRRIINKILKNFGVKLITVKSASNIKAIKEVIKENNSIKSLVEVELRKKGRIA